MIPKSRSGLESEWDRFLETIMRETNVGRNVSRDLSRA
jgi:hypothetical protein